MSTILPLAVTKGCQQGNILKEVQPSDTSS